MTEPFQAEPTAQGLRRYPPDGFYHAPAGFFTEPVSDPCVGLSDCECQACSLRSVVEHHDGSECPKE